LSGKARRNTGISGRKPGSTSGSRHGVGDVFTALRRQGLIADELVLQLATFLRSLDLFLELIVLAPRTLTANQVRHGGKQAQMIPSIRAFISALPSIDFTAAELSGPKITISLTSRSEQDVEPLDRVLGAGRHEINAALADPQMKARLAEWGATPLPRSPADFGKLIAEETEKWGKVVKFASKRIDPAIPANLP
jgi:hypothetical protein